MDPKQISALAVILLVALASTLTWKYVKNQTKDDTDRNIIKQPTAYIKVLSIVMIGLIFVTLYLLIFELDAFGDIGGAIAGMTTIGLLFLLALSLLINTINWKLEMFDSYVIHTNWIGRKRKYMYEELIVVDVKSGYRIYMRETNKRMFDISNFMDNYKSFVKAYSQYGKISKRK